MTKLRLSSKAFVFSSSSSSVTSPVLQHSLFFSSRVSTAFASLVSSSSAPLVHLRPLSSLWLPATTGRCSCASSRDILSSFTVWSLPHRVASFSLPPSSARSSGVRFDLRLFSGKGGRITNSSRSLPRQTKGTQHPEVLNRKTYWFSEHKPIRRTILTVLQSHAEVKHFCRLSRQLGADWIHQLSLPGPYTVFLPTDDAMAKIAEASLQRLSGDSALLEQFVKHHVVLGFWRFRDLIGSCYQPWKVYNEPRLPPKSLSDVLGRPIRLRLARPQINQLMRLHVLRPREPLSSLYEEEESGETEEGEEEGGGGREEEEGGRKKEEEGGREEEEEDAQQSKSPADSYDSSRQRCQELQGIHLHDWRQIVCLGSTPDSASRVCRPEMRCHNGIVHLIDSPLIPPHWLTNISSHRTRVEPSCSNLS